MKYYKTNVVLSNAEVIGMTTIVPKGASDDNPAPAVILTHGAGSQGYQELPFGMELARRGYVVFMLDRFDCGESANISMNFRDQEMQLMYIENILEYALSQNWCDGR